MIEKQMNFKLSNIPGGSVYINYEAFLLFLIQAMFPAQVGLLGIQMIWTRDSEVALKNAKVDKKVCSCTDEVSVMRSYGLEMKKRFE